VKAEVKELNRDEAIILMVESNLQRTTILPSEKAFAYKMRLEAINRQGQRTDLTSDPVGRKLGGVESAEIVGRGSGDSQTQVRRYVRLTNLLPDLLSKVDEGKIAMRPAVELSYLAEKEQKSLLDSMESEDCTPSYAQALKMRRFSQEGNLTDEVILSIMEEEKPNQKEQLKIPKERIAKFFPEGTPREKMEDTIVKALELYRKRERSMAR
jgi:ParB family chromosome partitioning protein